jgi:NADH:ubiquinone oxidoreductase subunit 6 (subunit J)
MGINSVSLVTVLVIVMTKIVKRKKETDKNKNKNNIGRILYLHYTFFFIRSVNKPDEY